MQPEHIGPNRRGDRSVDGTRHPAGPGRLRLVGLDAASRGVPRLLGRVNAGRQSGRLVGLPVADGRHHMHVQGVTGVGKSTWLAHLVLGEARA
ncbi:MAG: hypothetical protein ACRD0P_17600, partial [Stackebrandtia sp.]